MLWVIRWITQSSDFNCRQIVSIHQLQPKPETQWLGHIHAWQRMDQDIMYPILKPESLRLS